MVCRVGDWAQAWVVGRRCSQLMRDIGWLGDRPRTMRWQPPPSDTYPSRPLIGDTAEVGCADRFRRLPLAPVPYRPTWPDHVAGIRFCPGRQGATR